MRRRRLLIVVLLLVAFAGGLWWNASRLNATERRLVGVWKESEKTVGMYLPDRRLISVTNIDGKWIVLDYNVRWKASPNAIMVRHLGRPWPGLSIDEWQDYLLAKWNGEDFVDMDIAWITDNEFDYRDEGLGASYRSRDPVLLRIFDRLSAGEEPRVVVPPE